MSNRPDLSGQKIGKWTVLQKLGILPNKGMHTHYLCKCECGTELAIARTNLIRGVTLSCRKCALQNRKGHYRKILAPVFSRVKKAANKRQIEFAIDHEYVLEIMNKQDWKCAITGISLTVNYNSKLSNASLDRIDSNRGYIPGNVQWVYLPINMMKWKLSQEEFIKLCKLIAERYP